MRAFFYFICGLIGHNEKFCERIFETPLEQLEKSYGVWMRAEPRRKNHTIGSKWLRHSRTFPATTKKAETGDKKSVSDANNLAGTRDGSTKSGIQNNNLITGTQLTKSATHGIDITKNSHTSGNILIVITRKEKYFQIRIIWACNCGPKET